MPKNTNHFLSQFHHTISQAHSNAHGANAEAKEKQHYFFIEGQVGGDDGAA
jgi:hypothetical protein